jgi:hypothetical protein
VPDINVPKVTVDQLLARQPADGGQVTMTTTAEYSDVSSSWRMSSR